MSVLLIIYTFAAPLVALASMLRLNSNGILEAKFVEVFIVGNSFGYVNPEQRTAFLGGVVPMTLDNIHGGSKRTNLHLTDFDVAS